MVENSVDLVLIWRVKWRNGPKQINVFRGLFLRKSLEV